MDFLRPSSARLHLAQAFCAALTSILLLASPAARAEVAAPAQHTFAIGDTSFLLDSKPFVIRCGEIHFARVPREYWKQRLQMCHAMGLNTVCVYLFWNFHESESGNYNWSGQADVAEFCRLAQAEGLWVILRPGPYSCAEWEMGGLPWWLLNQEGIKLRSRDPLFMDPAKRYIKEFGRVLAPLQVTNGGPILMVQVENEYGFYGDDTEYMGELRRAVIDAGFNVPLFACGPMDVIAKGYRSDLFEVVNFGAGKAQASFEALRALRKTGPLMNGEYYPGWFDGWGRKHATGDVKPYLADLEYMLKGGISFSIYMAHGGTTFGLWSGADRPFIPDTSSYDYDAPISEAGWVTDKFTQTRELMGKYLLPGETLPEVPDSPATMTVPEFRLSESAPIFANLPSGISDAQPETMESYGQGHGCIDYRTTLPAGPAAELTAAEVHDFGWVFVEGKQVGVMDRRHTNYTVPIPARTAAVQVDILVEAMGRINFGKEILDHKGLIAPVTLKAVTGTALTVSGWSVFRLPLDETQLASLSFQAGSTTGPAFWRGHFDAPAASDTFLDLRAWSHGVAWVNGHCLGRFWNIGPTQTMYCPGPWLNRGENEVVILDLVGPTSPVLSGLAKPVLDELHPDLDFATASK